MKFFIMLLFVSFFGLHVSYGQTCQWAEKISGTNDDIANSIVVDGNGNIFVAGYFNSPTLDFNNGIVLTNVMDNDGYIAKYNSNGICQWAEQFGGTCQDYTSNIALDSSGNIYIIGYFDCGTLIFNNGISIVNSGGADAYIAKYNSSGICQWAEKLSGTRDERARSIAFDGNNNLYIVGSF